MPDPIPDVLRRAINGLVLDHEFYASLLMEMRLREVDDSAPPTRIGQQKGDKPFTFTMGTDGRHIFWSRPFVSTLTVTTCMAVLAHEVCHPMLLHLTRIYEHGISGRNWTPRADTHGRLVSRDPILWNIAGDYLINDMLTNSGFQLPAGGCLDPKYSIKTGWTTEKVYDDLLKKQPPNRGKGPGKGKSQVPGLTGSDLVEPDPTTDLAAAEEDWKDRVIRAATIAKSRGTLPGHLESLIAEYTNPVYPFWLLLERYVDMTLKDDDYSWRRPHPNFMNVGVILPSPYSERVSRVELWYDTSGSVPDSALAKFHRVGGDIIRNAAPEILGLGQCDAGVHSHQEFKAGTGDWPTTIEITGRGGTSFKPPFTYLADHAIQPSLLIYLTDLEGDFPSEPPPYPVLWISTTEGKSAPFGTTLFLDDDGS